MAYQVFHGDWETGQVTGSGNHNWGWSEQVATNRIRLLHDASRPGTFARFEVRPGDNPLDFCCDGTSRAEVGGMQRSDGTPIYENADSGIQTLRFSVKLDQSWQVISDVSPTQNTGAWGIFAQLHGPNARPPAFAFSATDEIRLNTMLGDITNASVTEHDLSVGSLAIGHWIDFELTVRFAADNTGFILVKRHDEGQVGFTTVLSLSNLATLQFDPLVNGGLPGDHYWKHGLYRNEQDFTSVLYLDGMTRSLGGQQGSAVAERMDGTGGNDILTALAGNDTLYGLAGADSLVGGTGVDVLHGNDGNDMLMGESQNDRLFGDAGRDWLHGGAGNDYLSGGSGHDTIDGGAGADRLTGSLGNDVFLFATVAESTHALRDVITGFTPGADKISLRARSTLRSCPAIRPSTFWALGNLIINSGPCGPNRTAGAPWLRPISTATAAQISSCG